ncbi:MAG: CBS domain-containing protein, partial [Bacteroidota bacterium]
MDTTHKADYDFLREFPPFDLLSADEFKLLFTKSQLTFIAEGESIFEQGKALKPNFFVVKKGTIKLYADEQLVDECDTGDIIGIRPHLGGGMYLSTAKAAQDSLVYQFSVERFKEILKQNAQVALFFAAGFASGISQAGAAKEDQSANTRKYLNVQHESSRKSFGVYTDTIELNPSRSVLTCSPADSIQEAARRMTERNVGSLIVTDEQKHPIGILTDTDFRRKVVSVSESIKNKTVSEIMSSPVACVNDGQSVAEAMLVMLRKKISHLCVTQDGTPNSPLVGILSQRDLIVQQGNSPAALVKQMQQTESIEKLAKLRDRAETLVAS